MPRDRSHSGQCRGRPGSPDCCMAKMQCPKFDAWRRRLVRIYISCSADLVALKNEGSTEEAAFAARIYLRDGQSTRAEGYSTLRKAIRGAQDRVQDDRCGRIPHPQVVSVQRIRRNRCRTGCSENVMRLAMLVLGATCGPRNRNCRGDDVTKAYQPKITKSKGVRAHKTCLCA